MMGRLLTVVAALLSSPLVNPVSSQTLIGNWTDSIAILFNERAPGFWDVLQSIGWGACPSVLGVHEFDPAKYLGTWYSQRQTPSFWATPDQSCVRAVYGNRTEKTWSSYLTHTRYYNHTYHTHDQCGYIYQYDPVDNPSRLAVAYDNSPNAGDYQVLEVDYDRVAAVYSCTNLPILNLDFLSSFIPLPFSPSIYFKFELGWIWTREINVNQSVIDIGMSAFTREGVSPHMIDVEQADTCQYNKSNPCTDGVRTLAERDPGELGLVGFPGP